MKIAFLNIYQTKVSRGGETFVNKIAERLSQNNFVNVLIGNEKIIPPWSKSFLWRFFLDRNSLVIAKFTFKNLAKIYKEKYQVVVPMNGGWQTILIRIITWLYGGKMVISGQSGIGWHERINLWSFPNAFIGLTEFQSRWAKRINPFVRVETIPNGVDLDAFKDGKPKAEKIILAVGAFTKEKRHELTIKAVAKIKDAKLLIAGSGGPEKDTIKELGEKVLGKRFQILSVGHDKMPQVYRGASVFAFPTVPWESFGIVLVEAMATGLPVVATDDPIRKEIVGDAGILVDPTDTEKYALALKTAMAKDWRDKPRKQAERFSWDRIAKEYQEVFKSLITK